MYESISQSMSLAVTQITRGCEVNKENADPEGGRRSSEMRGTRRRENRAAANAPHPRLLLVILVTAYRSVSAYK
jgi:hypothetical protein